MPLSQHGCIGPSYVACTRLMTHLLCSLFLCRTGEQGFKLSDFDLGPEIGRGVGGSVLRAFHRPKGMSFALKGVNVSSRLCPELLDHGTALPCPALAACTHPCCPQASPRNEAASLAACLGPQNNTKPAHWHACASPPSCVTMHLVLQLAPPPDAQGTADPH